MSEVKTDLPIEEKAMSAGDLWLNTYIHVTRVATEQITRMQNRLDTIRELLDTGKYEDVLVLTEKWKNEYHCEMLEAVNNIADRRKDESH